MIGVVIVAYFLYSTGQQCVEAQLERAYVRSNLTLRIVVRYPEIELVVSILCSIQINLNCKNLSGIFDDQLLVL